MLTNFSNINLLINFEFCKQISYLIKIMENICIEFKKILSFYETKHGDLLSAQTAFLDSIKNIVLHESEDNQIFIDQLNKQLQLHKKKFHKDQLASGVDGLHKYYDDLEEEYETNKETQSNQKKQIYLYEKLTKTKTESCQKNIGFTKNGQSNNQNE